MGTLQHFVGNMRSEAKRGKQRIESNRYKRWQTVKYVVLIAGLVAAFFGSMAIGWLDPFSLLVRSIGLSVLPAFNFAVRSVTTPLEHSHVVAIRVAGESLHTVLQAIVLDFRQAHFAQGLVLGILFLLILAASLRVTRLLVPRDLPAGRAAGFSVALVDSRSAQGCRDLRQVQSMPAALPGRRRSHRRSSLAQVRMPDVHELRRQLSASELSTSSSFRNEREVASPDMGRRKALDWPCRWRCRRSLDARQYRAWQEPATIGCCGRRARSTKTDFLSRCIRCGECMKVCPNNSLHPTFEQAGT